MIKGEKRQKERPEIKLGPRRKSGPGLFDTTISVITSTAITSDTTTSMSQATLHSQDALQFIRQLMDMYPVPSIDRLRENVRLQTRAENPKVKRVRRGRYKARTKAVSDDSQAQGRSVPALEGQGLKSGLFWIFTFWMRNDMTIWC